MSRISAERLMESIEQHLEYMRETSKQLKDYEAYASGVSKARLELQSLQSEMRRSTTSTSSEADLDEILGKCNQLLYKVMRLKFQSSSNYHYNPSRNVISDDSGGKRRDADLFYEPKVCKNIIYEEQSPAFKEFKARYDCLDTRTKMCLLCFSVFPENEIISKRFMIHWWIGEGFLPDDYPPLVNRTQDEWGDETFTKLMEMGFIEPAQEKKPQVNKCKLHPINRSALIMLAEKANFFDFDSSGNLTRDSTSLRKCLLQKVKVTSSSTSTIITDLSNIHTLFNVDTSLPEFEFVNQWLPELKNVHVICLGRRTDSPDHQIVVENHNFLENLKTMKHLRFLSLQGVSGIVELPRYGILNLVSLMVLNLRACHNLMSLPREIGSLRSLTHLDVSRCYLLDRMPKEISNLIHLQVLKGFVLHGSKLSTSCSLGHLKKLRLLRKLSISVPFKDFPQRQELEDLHSIKKLTKLKITWGRNLKDRSDNLLVKQPTLAVDPRAKVTRTLTGFHNLLTRSHSVNSELPSQLQKLDLDCFPQTETSTWLVEASKLEGLKKLYLRGGTLCDLGQFDVQNVKWNVEVLRLKYLNHLDIDWTELRHLFPKLKYLETVKCPGLFLFPCDKSGVWTRRGNAANQDSFNL